MPAADESLPPAEVQREQLENLIEKNVELGETWYIVDAKWLEQWKVYVGLLNAANNADIPPPGPIQTQNLVNEDEPLHIREDLSEGENYSFIVSHAYEVLKNWYTVDGPDFPRATHEVGYMPRIELRPQVCIFSKLVNADAGPEGEVKTLVSRDADTNCLKKLALSHLNLPGSSETRLWISVPREADADAAAAGTEEEAIVSIVGAEQTLSELAANDPSTRFILEVRTAGVWPKGDLADVRLAPDTDRVGASVVTETAPYAKREVTDLAAWRAGLKVGSWLDARDLSNDWYDAEVVDIQPYGGSDKLRIHFHGWGSKFDSWCLRSSPTLQPLWTKVKNWRDFRVKDKVEFKDGRGWWIGAVENVDKEAQKITIRHKKLGDVVYSIGGDDIAAAYTHTRKPWTAYNAYAGRSNREASNAFPGVVGLSNLGNTCFMNSMLQCLSNTEPLTRYFVSAQFRAHINTNNVLGTGGRLAEAYGSWLQEVWSGRYSVVTPSNLKQKIGDYAPQFAGYQQQDSQELMSFVLDGLHEDLNLIERKPYVEDVESKGRPDEVVAAEAWEAYKKRNVSFIQDTFMGQLKSHVQCNVCGKESVTFDPFSSLSVPIPAEMTRRIVVTLVPYHGGKPLRMKAVVPKRGVIDDLRNWVADATGFDPHELVIADIYNGNIYRYLRPADALTSIRSTDFIFVYQIRRPPMPEIEGPVDGGEAPPPTTGQQLRRNLIQLRLRRQARGSYFTSLGDPFTLNLYSASDEYQRPPTQLEVFEEVWKFMQRFLLEEGKTGEFNATNPPYRLLLADAYSEHWNNVALEPKPTAVTMDPRTKVLLVVMPASPEELARVWDDAAVGDFDTHESWSAAAASSELTLQRCMDSFNTQEQLSQNDMWYCSDCKEHRRAFKKMQLWSLPECLILHLKRFQYSEGGYFIHRDKIDALVDYPLEGLDMAPFVVPRPDGEPSSPILYDLYAVSCHSGGLGGGHYTAYGKNFLNNKWYDFNDSFVRETSANNAVTREGYVLFYRRRRSPSCPLFTPPSVPALSADYESLTREMQALWSGEGDTESAESADEDEVMDL